MKVLVVLSLAFVSSTNQQGFEDDIEIPSLLSSTRTPKGSRMQILYEQTLPPDPVSLERSWIPPRFGPRKVRYVPQTTPEPEPNRLLGTVVKISGSLLGIAGEVAKHAGSFLYNSGHIVRSGGEMLTHVGVAVEHSGAVLNSASLVARHSGDLIHKDSRFSNKAQRGLICALVCPVKTGEDKRLCLNENCETSYRKEDDLQRVSEGRVGEHRSAPEETNIIGFGANLIVSGTRMISDIAFVKMRLLQGLFSPPNCTNQDVNDIGCVSAYCALPDDEKKSYSGVNDSCTTSTSDKEMLISTVLGPVVGRKEVFQDERFNAEVKYLSFTGIPYAAPPTGLYRYGTPRKVSPWRCPLDATRFRNKMCPQISIGVDDEGMVPGSEEDCLYLNVYVPQPKNFTGIDKSRYKPVLVYIHGGAFMFGSGAACWYGPEFWIIHDIIVVTFNYRLGPLGFLSLGNKEIPGNSGMLDQVEALKWVQENIRSYGGDPGQVTLMGQSAGSFSATYHLVSPLSRGLFKRIIGHSGVGGFSPSYHQYSQQQAVKFGAESAALIGCTDQDSQLRCLQKKPVSEIMSMDVRNEFLSQPVVDGNYSDTPFLPDDPKELIRRGSYDKNVDILLGFNSEEGLMVTSLFKDFPLLYTAMAAGWPVLGPFSLLGRHHKEITEKDTKIVNQILAYYVGNVTDIGPDKLNNITDMYTDSFFSYGVHNFLKHHLKHTRANTYQYVYSYKGETGPGHSSEIPLFWGTHKGKRWIKSKEELELSGQLTTIWSNFVKYGTPSTANQFLRSRSSRKLMDDEGYPARKPQNFSWTNLAKKEPYDNILRISDEHFSEYLRVDRRLKLFEPEPRPKEYLDISLNMKMSNSENWERRMKFWEGILNDK